MLDIFLKFFLFTFHYGSILIILWFWAGYILFFIYIPLWFYSNVILTQTHTIMLEIYIPLWFYSNLFRASEWAIQAFIYIPLWFYSNPINFKISRTQHIYIPLWFYSNLFFKKHLTFSYVFTFHYGSILIWFL